MSANIEEQSKTVEYLLSHIDKLNVVKDEYSDDGALVFDGEGIDGPCIGYVEPDGKVSWLACGGMYS